MAINPDKNRLFRELDLVRVKGRKRPERIFELLSEGGDWINNYALALKLFRERKWKSSAAAFKDVIKSRGGDRASEVFLSRMADYSKMRLDGDWDAVFDI